MLGLPSVASLKPVQFVLQRLSSRNGRLILMVLTGFSMSILAAGYLLQRRRRRYRGVSTTNSLQRLNTFQHSRQNSFQYTPNHAQNHAPLDKAKIIEVCPSEDLAEGEEPLLGRTHQLDTDSTDGGMSEREQSLTEREKQSLTEREEGERQSFEDDSTSVASDDSFHSTQSTVELLGVAPVGVAPSVTHNQLYLSAMELVVKGGVKCRKLRTELLCCADDEDFLAKVHCVRLAFDDLVQSSSHRQYFVEVGRNIMSAFLRDTNQDPSVFVDRFNALTCYMEQERNWEVAKKELTSRQVACMNVYDIALDFILLDAFEDLDNPPGTIVAVLQNRWITTGMKTSALSAAIWSISKAKKSILKHNNGFMSQFYSLSETITPTLAWGFLGTDHTLKGKCSTFKSSVLRFVRSIFSQEEVRYNSVASLSDDILRLAQHTAHTMDPT